MGCELSRWNFPFSLSPLVIYLSLLHICLVRDKGCLSVMHVAHSKRRSADNYWSVFQPRASFLFLFFFALPPQLPAAICTRPCTSWHQNTLGPHQSYRHPRREVKTLASRKKRANRHASGEAAAWDWVVEGKESKRGNKAKRFETKTVAKLLKPRWRRFVQQPLQPLSSCAVRRPFLRNTRY